MKRILIQSVLMMCLLADLMAQSGKLTVAASDVFVLKTASRTSAGVFKDGILVRTLWSNKRYEAGTHPLSNAWDGKDDLGNVLPDGSYTIKVLSNNVTHTWEGVIGNTSDKFTGSTVHHPGETIIGMVVEGQTAYFTAGYNEIAQGHMKFNLATPGSKSMVITTGGQCLRHVCSDGTTVYWTGSNNSSSTYFIVGTNISDDSQTQFADGTQYTTEPGKTTYTKALNVTNTQITGIAVQRTGAFLFCAHAPTNQIRVFNKMTGALVQTLTSVNNPRELVIKGDDLWVISNQNTVAKYTISNTGTLSGPVLTLTGLVYPMALALSPTGELAVMDSGTKQQVRFFNTSTGQESTPLGKLGGYATSPVVTNKKFFFNNTKVFREDNYGSAHGYLCYQPDGGLWVGDYGNLRSLLFSNTKDHQTTLQWMGYSYSVQADKNKPGRIFCDYLEFARDYNKPLSPTNGSWTFTNNWAYGMTAAKDNEYLRLFSVATLANDRTYAFNGADNNQVNVVELPPSGNMRYTGLSIPNTQSALFPDGSRWISGSNVINAPLTLTKEPLNGFDVSNNPIWGAATAMVSGLSVTASDPVTYGGGGNVFALTSTGVLVTYSRDRYIVSEKRGDGFHLGGIVNNKWSFKTSPSTHVLYIGDYPSDGYYDIGNRVEYSGSFVQAVDQSIIWGYYGEFWKNSQTNKYNHYWDNGLMIGQFGTTGPDEKFNGEASAEMAGNAINGTLVKVGTDYYLYHCDEYHHSGIHSWKISNLSSIEQQSIDITKQGPYSPVLDYDDLMTDIPFRDTLRNNIGRWSRSSGEYNRGAYDKWSITTGRTTYKASDRDIYVDYQPVSDNQSQWVRCDLGTNTLSKWRLTGEMAYPEFSESNSNYLEVLDQNDKVIVRISRPESFPGMKILANSAPIVEGPLATLSKTFQKLQPITLSSDGTKITVSYAQYAAVTTGVLEAGADITRPKTLRVYFYSDQRRGHIIALANLRIYKN